jgi:membrane protease YdiL (CAAX protease family)
MGVLIGLTVLPLPIILIQWLLGAEGSQNLPYKLAFLIPPLIYCRVRRISIRNDILKFSNWRNGLKPALILGVVAMAVFWGTYFALSDLLLDKDAIVATVQKQFSVTATTVFFVAVYTIFVNSLLEEFFYRGFAFGLLARRNALLAYLLPAAAFTFQHVFFFYVWGMSAVPNAIAVVGLFVFALVAQKMYAHADSIVAPWVIHMFGDVAMMGVAVEMLYR